MATIKELKEKCRECKRILDVFDRCVLYFGTLKAIQENNPEFRCIECQDLIDEKLKAKDFKPWKP